ncbi:hypothetical protein [Aerococcus sp. 1KP-2016]|uniref:hypothetical protein n=1 Tax=Aerococcus sp. 1KP-2016 TaxID=1981982 RepID=UPI000B98F6AD|nr:hypothetical protein [Aerococcus sp. 1KP-2016]OYQ66692.1 hypothetical protein B9P78_05545 [Aerococcus sp. 1KP-2016]
MSLLTIIAELWRFFINNIVKIIIGTIIVMAITIGARVLLSSYIENTAVESVTSETAENETLTPEEIEASYELLGTVYDQEPAEFSFVAVNQEGIILGNSFILDEYLSRPDVLTELEAASGVDIASTLQAQANVGLEKTRNFRGGLAAVRNSSTDEITMRVLVGQTAEENLAVAESIYQYLQAGKVPFYENYELTFLSTPEIGEDLVLEDNPMVPTPGTLSGLQPQQTGGSLVFYGVLGAILGVILSTAILFALHFFSKKITYAYDYAWDFDDYQRLVDGDKIDADALHNWLLIPADKNRVAVAQNTANEMIQEFASQHLPVANTISAGIDTPEEIILFIESGQTDKDWYKQQFELSKLYEARLKIVHFK